MYNLIAYNKFSFITMYLLPVDYIFDYVTIIIIDWVSVAMHQLYAVYPDKWLQLNKYDVGRQQFRNAVNYQM